WRLRYGRRLFGFLGFFRFFVFIATLAGGFDWADQHMGVAAFQTRLAFHGAIGRQILGEAHEQLLPQIRVSDFAAPELNHGFHAIALLQEADCVLLFEVVIVIVGIGAELELLYLNHVLLLAGIVRLLFLLVLIMAEIDGFGDRRNRRG